MPLISDWSFSIIYVRTLPNYLLYFLLLNPENFTIMYYCLKSKLARLLIFSTLFVFFSSLYLRFAYIKIIFSHNLESLLFISYPKIKRNSFFINFKYSQVITDTAYQPIWLFFILIPWFNLILLKTLLNIRYFLICLLWRKKERTNLFLNLVLQMGPWLSTS